MKNDAEKGRSRSQARKKASRPASPPSTVASPSTSKNVGSLESGLSLLLGIFIVIAALFPRSIKQLVLLGMGGGLVYRGMTSHCGVYKALDIDTEKGSLIGQVSEKLLAARRV